MKNSLFIGKIAGIKIFMHWTFPFIIFWNIFSDLSRGFNAAQVTWSVIFILLLFFCVVLHELGHALAAKRYHIHTKDITLLPIGGLARLEKMPEKPIQELIVALAGPAVNYVIVLFLFGFLHLTKLSTDFSAVSNVVTADNFFLNLAILNFWLATFNLIPAFPMDGGRVLRALLAFRLGRILATNIAARIGQALSIVFILTGFLYNPFLIFIGLFIFFGAMAEAEQVQFQAAFKNVTLQEIMWKDIPVVNKEDSLDKVVELLLNGQATNFLVLDGDQPYGMLQRDEIIKALQKHPKYTPAEMVVDTNLAFIDVNEPIENALLLLQHHSMLIVTKNNDLYGVADKSKLLEYMRNIKASAGSENELQDKIPGK